MGDVRAKRLEALAAADAVAKVLKSAERWS